MILRWLSILLQLCSFVFLQWVNHGASLDLNNPGKSSSSLSHFHSQKEVLFEIINPALVYGRFKEDLNLALTNQGYCLAGGIDRTGVFEASVEFLKPKTSFSLDLFGRGEYKFEIYNPHQGWDVIQVEAKKKFNWQKIEFNMFQAVGNMRYRVSLKGDQALFCKLMGPEIIPLDSHWPMVISTDPMRTTSGYWAGTIGVNIEAEYLFLELDRQQRRLLLQQAKVDGFNSIRLHKLTRLIQSIDFNSYFEDTLQDFLDDLAGFGFTLSLDILSWPLKTTLSTGELIEDGWKQWAYVSSELHNRIYQIIDWLSGFYLYARPLFKSEKLIGICLFNENSLYAEIPKNLLSKPKDRCKTMLRVGSAFRNVLRKKGYSGRIFLSNYQLYGEDQICNMRFSKSLDRHIYFDYPQLNYRRVKVGGRSPLEFLNYWKAFYRKLFQGASERWISEINLPWPNQFMHEVLPIILTLHKEKKLNGLWFYDYRLRSPDFHLGGPFGIQRFRSVIEPLGWFKSFLNEPYEIEYKNMTLDIKSDGGSITCFLRGHPIKRVPHCLWEREYSNFVTGPERSLGDQFDPQFLFQTEFGKKAMNIKF